jgi:hypothetical protein
MTRPNPQDCCEPSHVGRLHHDTEEDVWYECVSDERRGGMITWVALPPDDVVGSAHPMAAPSFPEREG